MGVDILKCFACLDDHLTACLWIDVETSWSQVSMIYVFLLWVYFDYTKYTLYYTQIHGPHSLILAVTVQKRG